MCGGAPTCVVEMDGTSARQARIPNSKHFEYGQPFGSSSEVTGGLYSKTSVVCCRTRQRKKCTGKKLHSLNAPPQQQLALRLGPLLLCPPPAGCLPSVRGHQENDDLQDLS